MKQVYNVLKEVSNSVKGIKPGIEMAMNTYPSCGNDIEECLRDHSQDIGEALKYADYVVLMAYHRLEGKPVNWITEVTKGAVEKGGDRVIIKLQTKDWETDKELPEWELRRMVDAALNGGGKSMAFFPGFVKTDVFSEEAEKGIVIFNLDDIQGGWLEQVSINLTETHISYGVDVTIGVIPQDLNRMAARVKDWHSNHGGTIEIAHHGLSHENIYKGKSYEEQKSLVQAGKDIFLSLGITPYTFIPPLSEADETTLRVAKDLGYHTLMAPADIDVHIDDFFDMENAVLLCEQENMGYECEIKSSDVIIREIDNKITEEGMAFVSYHIQDITTAEDELDNNKYRQLAEMFSELKLSGKYTFMTAEEYYQSHV